MSEGDVRCGIASFPKRESIFAQKDTRQACPSNFHVSTKARLTMHVCSTHFRFDGCRHNAYYFVRMTLTRIEYPSIGQLCDSLSDGSPLPM
jgi:hypothetical protein